MHKLFISLSMAALCLLAACSPAGSSERASESSSVESTEYSTIEEQALAAAQQFVRSQYASDAVFQQSGTIIEETDVPNRYKVLQRFDSNSRDGYNFVYRIWVQKFPSGWEFGNLGIERAGGETVLTTNGRMKEIERQNMTQQEAASAGSVDYTIIKRNAPNYVRVYTAKRLDRDDVLAIYNQLKNDYEIVQFSTSRNPDDDDYMAIQYGSVYEHDKNKITKLADY
jgi:hypothetical protein